MELIKHPLREKFENLATGDTYRVLVFVYKYINIPRASAEVVLDVLNGFVKAIGDQCDIYERMPFRIEVDDLDSPTVSIYGRYGFSDATVIGKPKVIPMLKAYHETMYGGDAIKLEGIYTRAELDWFNYEMNEKREYLDKKEKENGQEKESRSDHV